MLLAPRDKAADRQRWATPSWLVRGVEALTERPIEVDLCAEAWSAKAPVWLGPGSTVAEDAFTVPWADYWRTAWCNPPYASIDPWVERALAEAERGLVTWLLVPDRTERSWWAQLCRAGAHPCFLEAQPHRIAFEPPPGVEPSTPMGGVVLWQVGGRDCALPLSIHRDAIERAARARGRRRAAS